MLSCPSGKDCHRTREHAVKHLTALLQEKEIDATTMNVYHCLSCFHWHIGRVTQATALRTQARQRKGYL